MVKFVSLFFLLGCLLGGTVKADELLTFSDIHFNPFETCKVSFSSCPLIKQLNEAPADQWNSILKAHSPTSFSESGQETNFALLQALLQMAPTKSHPDLIFLGGDYLGHAYHEKYVLYAHDFSQQGYQHFVQQTLIFLMEEIHQAFPGTPLALTLGNNDSYSGDYVSTPDGRFYQDMGTIALPLLNQTLPDFSQTFNHGGYYVFPYHSNEIVVLNSVIFSANGSVATGSDISLDQLATEELTWLDNTLSDAQKHHQNVWILMHIPDVVDVYASGKAKKKIHLWNPNADQAFMKILEKYPNTVQAIFTGHFHTEGSFIYTFTDPTTGKPIQLLDTYLPGIDSTHRNKPGFKRYTFDSQNLKIKHAFSIYFTSHPA